ncbi:hypothetical protein OH77DRAFT_180887 [Trametes cingulata]|nr:hypothetical protein OH77DRAFT_180887 [Trametes cingulata]
MQLWRGAFSKPSTRARICFLRIPGVLVSIHPRGPRSTACGRRHSLRAGPCAVSCSAHSALPGEGPTFERPRGSNPGRRRSAHANCKADCKRQSGMTEVHDQSSAGCTGTRYLSGLRRGGCPPVLSSSSSVVAPLRLSLFRTPARTLQISSTPPTHPPHPPHPRTST